MLLRAGTRHSLWIAAALAAGCGGSPPTPTFARDVAPILFQRCAECHRPGGDGPFSLLTYADAAKHASDIAAVTASRAMPPWLPDPGEFPVLGVRRLSDQQIDTIQRWVKGGAIEGNAADVPKAPSFPDGWQLGVPSIVATPATKYVLKSLTEDVYRNLVIRTGLDREVFVRAVEFKTNGAPVHHAVIRVDPTGVSRQKDGEDGQPGFDGMGWQNAQDPDGHFIGWAPGRGPIVSPDGMPWRLARGADLVVEVHMIPGHGGEASVQPSLGLFFTDTPPARTPLTVKMGSKLIDIPAGASGHVVSDDYELPVDVDLLSVYPHAHYLARDMLLTATLPHGVTKSLLHIKEWDFHWQQDYRYVTPIRLPRGTKLAMRYTYDNSAQNPSNPHRPPVRVRMGPKSTDEMAELGLQLMPGSRAEAAQLSASFAERQSRQNVTLGEMRVRDEPKNAEYRAFLGGAYIEVGRFEEAVPHLEEALRLDPKNADALSDLGTTLMLTGKLDQAITTLRRAASLSPKNESIQFNLGNAFKQANRFSEAAAAYQRAIALNPGFPDAHMNLGALLHAQGRTREALPHFERAVELMPNSAVLRSNLASALASSGRLRDALAEVQRALAIDPNYAPAQEVLKTLNRMGIR